MKVIDFDVSQLNSTEEHIINSINEDPNLFVSSKIHELAKYYHVSTSTVTRLLQKIGYSDFKSAQLDVKEKMVANNFYTLDKSGTPSAVVNNLKSSVIYTVNKTFDSWNDAEIEFAAAEIINADRIIVYGLEERRYSSSIFVEKLLDLNLNIRLVTNSYDLLKKLVYATKNSIVFIVLRKEPWEEIFSVIKHIRDEIGCKVILLSEEKQILKKELIKRKISTSKISILLFRNSTEYNNLVIKDLYTYSGDLIIFESIYQMIIYLKPEIEQNLKEVDILYKKIIREK